MFSNARFFKRIHLALHLVATLTPHPFKKTCADSHTDLSKMERDAYYYGHEDMQSFVRSELTRRQKKGITSMSALAPDAEKAGEIDDDDEAITF